MNLSILTARRRADNTTSATFVVPAILLAFFAMLLVASVAYAANIRGDNGPDTLAGTKKADTIRGLGGADEISGLRGKDRLFGDSGTDFIDGGSGGELMVGGTGSDILFGASGNDTIYTGTKTEGKDRASDEVRCGGGYDVVYLSGRDHASHNVEAKDVCEEIHNY